MHFSLLTFTYTKLSKVNYSLYNNLFQCNNKILLSGLEPRLVAWSCRRFVHVFPGHLQGVDSSRSNAPLSRRCPGQT